MPPQTYRVRICILTRPSGDTYGHSSLRSTDAAPFRIDRNVGEMICQWQTQIMETRIWTVCLRTGGLVECIWRSCLSPTVIIKNITTTYYKPVVLLSDWNNAISSYALNSSMREPHHLQMRKLRLTEVKLLSKTPQVEKSRAVVKNWYLLPSQSS